MLWCCGTSEDTPAEAVTAEAPRVVASEKVPLEEAPAAQAPAAQASGPTPVSSVTFTFSRVDKSSVDLVFRSRPLGIDFTRSVPLSVKGIRKGTAAEFTDVRIGWTLEKVNGAGVPDTFEAATRLVSESIRGLPEGAPS
eukprot:TRINITY_DN86896_c0_g1_i1.p1 TRINITY_DN86896_c0_g1~~TRINITY_DN86896_c0_g1_i1.p1  ORF type:complete len:139 (-),score=25.74 TRINITY_DN86896_c0_g1_i1:89-505(-)